MTLMPNLKMVRDLAFNPAAPRGIRLVAELWLGRRAVEILAGRPEPELSEFLVEHFYRPLLDGNCHALPPALLAGAGVPPDLDLALDDDPPGLPEALLQASR